MGDFSGTLLRFPLKKRKCFFADVCSEKHDDMSCPVVWCCAARALPCWLAGPLSEAKLIRKPSFLKLCTERTGSRGGIGLQDLRLPLLMPVALDRLSWRMYSRGAEDLLYCCDPTKVSIYNLTRMLESLFSHMRVDVQYALELS